MYADRIRRQSLLDKIVTPEEAALLIKDGMTIGMSGFTRAGDAKALPIAIAERAAKEPIRITLMTGASLGNNIDKILTEAGVLARRLPFQSDPTLRAAINRGEVMFIDQHLSETVEQLRSGQMGPIDYAIVEATAITADGGIVPTTSVGNTASFAILAEKVIVELNLSQPLELEGLHDIYIPTKRPSRTPIPVVSCDSRAGTPYIPIDPAKIAAIVVTHKHDSAANVEPPDDGTRAIAGHLIDFFKHEVARGRLDMTLNPLQAGIGSIANAVLHGLIDSPFHDLRMYSEVLQDSTFDLFDAGKLNYASGSSVTLSAECGGRVFSRIAQYRNRLVLRPQEISNHPEVIRRLGVIGINTALEFDIYGNVNSTHVDGTMMMNGIGGSGDFARNAYLSIFVTKSLAKGGAISSVVPMVSHVDHTEHDVDILVTEVGLADLRGLAPRERAGVVIANCVHPSYRDQLSDYFNRAKARGGHTPHLLEEAFSWHVRRQQTGSMKG
ncbi:MULTISPECIES: acetyl-CoA hydrolase/transferase family protein [unclassified Azospirillum]|uniref:acetyl-CoA hydrolase/transferase family protein n=1 Tax=unclassified Azospirillum TaxID=2630922 RepID=UPI000B6BD68F|nr:MULTISPECIES: acetyl-CoA hydrolase/transferase family protein [unclassified Azospirillum]SNS57354.1 succinyl-CoA:acetate CoA-transferase [Azospirillum sp. RU38E]SNS77148.1 succinyl-CoA:acetate CoA-transferase [Azospirillum sp. RU37A]